MLKSWMQEHGRYSKHLRYAFAVDEAYATLPMVSKACFQVLSDKGFSRRRGANIKSASRRIATRTTSHVPALTARSSRIMSRVFHSGTMGYVGRNLAVPTNIQI